MAAEGKIRVGIFGHDAGFGKSMDSAWKKADTFQKKMALVGGGMQKMGRAMTMYVTAPIVAGMALSVKAAIDEEKEMALLSKALTTNTNATKAQVAATETWITATQNATGIADGELRPALASLVAATKDTGKAQDLLSVAMDVAAAKGKPLAAVTTAMAKAYLGNVGALGRLGIATKDFSVDSTKAAAARAALAKAEETYEAVLKDSTKTAADRAVAAARVTSAQDTLKKALSGTTGEALTFEQVMKNAVKTYGGAAATAADTTAGRMAILKAKIADLSETLGTALIPFVQDAVKWLTKAADWAARHKDFLVKALTVAAAIGPLNYVVGTLLRIIELGKVIAGMKILGGLGSVLAGKSLATGPAVTAAATAGGAAWGAAFATAAGVAMMVAWPLALAKVADKLGGAKGYGIQSAGAAAGTKVAPGVGRYGTVLSDTKNAYAPIVQKLSVQLDTASYAKFHKLYADIRNLQELAKKGIVLSLDKLGKMAPAALDSLRNTIMDSLGVTKKRAEQLLNDIAGKNLNFKVAKQFGAELKKTQATVTSQGGAIVKSLLSSGTKGGAALPAGMRTGLGPTRTAAAALKSAATSPAATIKTSYTQAGRDAWKGLVGGLNAGIGPVLQAANALAAAAESGVAIPLKTNSPSKVMHAIGLDVAMGLANGIAAGVPLVRAVGADIITGLAIGMDSASRRPADAAVAAARKTVKALTDQLEAAKRTLAKSANLDKSVIAEAQSNVNKLERQLERANVVLDKAVAKRERVIDRLRNGLSIAQDALDGAMQASASLRDSIMGTIDLWPKYIEVLDTLTDTKVSTLELPSVVPLDPADIQKVMDANLGAMRDWVANVAKLTAAGLPKSLLDQLVSMGLGGAGQVAGLAAMTAGELEKWISGWLELQRLAGQQAKDIYQVAIAGAADAITEFTGLLSRAIRKIDTVLSKSGSGTKLASGGLVTRPTMALVGESGPELVIPLSRLGSVSGVNSPTIIHDNSRLVINLPPSLSPAQARSIAHSEIAAFEARKAAAKSAATRGMVRG